ncbi:hypothetical protein ACFE04_007915 [Oxalis oulophora]
MKIKESNKDTCTSEFLKHLENRGISLKNQELRTIEADNGLMLKLRAQLEPFRCIADDMIPWEEKSAALSGNGSKGAERFNQADQEADDWRAMEIAKDIAKRKMEKMKEIVKLKAKEERRKLESELELVLTVQKLQELCSLRIQKLKKKGQKNLGCIHQTGRKRIFCRLVLIRHDDGVRLATEPDQDNNIVLKFAVSAEMKLELEQMGNHLSPATNVLFRYAKVATSINGMKELNSVLNAKPD